jgi:hypothetical protein
MEIKNVFNNRLLTIGDLGAESQLIQQFQLNPQMVILKIHKNF